MSKRIINFNAGPAAIPEQILLEAQKDLLNYQNSGMSVMEMSHRSKAFIAIQETAEATLREIYAIPANYKVLFLQGGASQQFAMIPLNLSVHKKAAYINSGSWTKKAIAEAKKTTTVEVLSSSEEDNFLRLPNIESTPLSDGYDYLYTCSNNTIFGTQMTTFPSSETVPLVCDMSSDILSRKLNISDFGVIFAGAQKNIGPSGVTIVIIRDDLIDRCPDHINKIFNYKTHVDAGSMYNTPPTFGIYMAGLTFKWIKDQGGLAVIEQKNNVKAKLLYDAIDNSNLLYCPVEESSRSKMNIVFRVKNNHVEMEEKLILEAEKAGITGVKGHRSVGGLRASIYNAQTLENIQAFVDFLTTFEAQQS